MKLKSKYIDLAKLTKEGNLSGEDLARLVITNCEEEVLSKKTPIADAEFLKSFRLLEKNEKDNFLAIIDFDQAAKKLLRQLKGIQIKIYEILLSLKIFLTYISFSDKAMSNKDSRGLEKFMPALKDNYADLLFLSRFLLESAEFLGTKILEREVKEISEDLERFLAVHNIETKAKMTITPTEEKISALEGLKINYKEIKPKTPTLFKDMLENNYITGKDTILLLLKQTERKLKIDSKELYEKM